MTFCRSAAVLATLWALAAFAPSATALTAHGRLLHLVPNARSNSHQSNNWFGYNQGALESGGKIFHSITAGWRVPRASRHGKRHAEYSSDWIGIGGGCVDRGCGLTDGTLIQTGTEQDVPAHGTPAYSAWWEIIPGPSLTIRKLHIRPGDRIRASIQEVLPLSNVWRITIRDVSRREAYTVSVPYTSTQDTAEWIEETPLILSSQPGFAALPNLSSPRFDRATTNGHPARLKRSEEMFLTNSAGKVIGAPSAPDPDNDGFNACTWATSCAAPGSS
ncbi:MAG: G1 family glutamic endopeptidase [Solirubrobacteraceae bacterium]